MVQIATRYGMMMVPDINNDIIGRFLYHYGEWAWLETQFIASIIPHNAKILDIGAFAGTFSLGLAAQGMVSSVVAVEANSMMIPFLGKNFSSNLDVPFTIIDRIVVENTSIPMYSHIDKENIGGTFFSHELPEGNEPSDVIPTITFSEILDAYGPFDLIKFDIEGSELAILKSDEDFIKNTQSVLWIECNENQKSLDLAEFLLSCGLNVTYFAFPSHNPENAHGRQDCIFPWSYEAGLLATSDKNTPALDIKIQPGCILKPIRSVEDIRLALWYTPRWGMLDWHGQSIESVVALSGHTLRQDNYKDFLAKDWKPGIFVWDKISQLETSLNEERKNFDEERNNFEIERKSLITLNENISSELNAVKQALGRDLETANKIIANFAVDFSDLKRRLVDSELKTLDFIADHNKLNDDYNQLNENLNKIKKEKECLEEKNKNEKNILEEKILIIQKDANSLREKYDQNLKEIGNIRENYFDLLEKYNSNINYTDQITRSTSWRIARHVHVLLNAMPQFKKALVFSRKAGGRVRRFMKNIKN
ncbi:FkbM family methyltransferase [Granulibacter bethesdensis]|uniref:FkbM family methyltransferase n=1 Tax=Granulibacter bethesdensis TaxID=364410 RepID=UPI0009094BF9|nr:FkbM family methyltransferase [Granulibacter bethesdensis]APH59874.1 Hypothetical protein GbCGDNIH7_7253 [Granulibacter bethesdensis]